MLKIHASKNYFHVSNIYDHIMRKIRYDYWADYIYAISDNFVNENGKVLELGAGSCKLARFLSEYYPKLIATDLSLIMLKKYPKYLYGKLCCDMAALPFNSKFDLIISAFDSVNYLTSKKKLYSLFKEINRIITDKGIFTFDVSLENNSYKHIKNPVRTGLYKGVKYRQESDYNSEKNLHRNIFYVTYPNGSVFREIHIQKIYSFEIYFEIIETAGLIVKECYDAFTFKDGSSDSSRVQFIVTKN